MVEAQEREEPLSEAKAGKILDAVYEKALNGIPMVSRSVDEIANDYLSRHDTPEPAANPIAICSSRLPSSSSRNSTPDTLHGSGSCRAAVNNDVVSIPPNYPTSTTTPPTHSPTPNSERPSFFSSAPSYPMGNTLLAQILGIAFP